MNKVLISAAIAGTLVALYIWIDRQLAAEWEKSSRLFSSTRPEGDAYV